MMTEFQTNEIFHALKSADFKFMWDIAFRLARIADNDEPLPALARHNREQLRKELAALLDSVKEGG